jgi:plasmid stabilization system protein ParE
MRLSFHPRVQKDINAILRRYDETSTRLGDQFFAELTAAFNAVMENPHRGHIQEADVRRFNLITFPFHFLYRVLSDRVRITIVKHHKRHPNLGMRRR